MPWKECSSVSLRKEFIVLAMGKDANIAELCRRLGISRKTGYKWLDRFRAGGELADRSRRPRRSPGKTDAAVESAVLATRGEHPAWGGRKIHARLKTLGQAHPPAPSTISGILHRHGLIDPTRSAGHRTFQRFERPEPNDLWQMDFKGHFALDDGRRCHPLTVLDDHSRYALGLRACGDERTDTVRSELTAIFRVYGLPRTILADNGPPWGEPTRRAGSLTALEVWLMRLGVRVTHGRPYHPQTQGKDERFHRTLKAEVLAYRRFADMPAAQGGFDGWREVYNVRRPHQALGMQVPASRYRLSPRAFPQTLPPIEYGPDDQVRRVRPDGLVRFKGRGWRLTRGLIGYPVAIRPTHPDGVHEVYFCAQRVGRIDLRTARPASGEAAMCVGPGCGAGLRCAQPTPCARADAHPSVIGRD